MSTLKFNHSITLGNELYFTQNAGSTYLTPTSANILSLQNTANASNTQFHVLNNGSTNDSGFYAFHAGSTTSSAEYIRLGYSSSSSNWSLNTVNSTTSGSARSLVIAAGSNNSGGVNTNQLVLNTDGTISIAGNISIGGTVTSGTWNGTTLGVPFGGTGASSFTANAILYGNGTSALQSSSNLTFTGTALRLNTATGTAPLNIGYNSGTNQISLHRSDGGAAAGVLYIDSSNDLYVSSNANLFLRSTGTISLGSASITGLSITNSSGTVTTQRLLQAGQSYSGSPVASTASFFRVPPNTWTDSGTAASGTASSNFMAAGFRSCTVAATNASVTTPIATTMYIEGSPTAGTNQTLTTRYALWVDDGTVQIDDTLNVSTLSKPIATYAGSDTFKQFGVPTTNLLCQLKLSDLTPTQNPDTTVGTWGIFTQATDASRPIYRATGGYRGGPFLDFGGSTSMSAGSRTFAFTTGFTAICLVRFPDITSFGRIFDFSSGVNTNQIVFGRNSTNTSLLFRIYSGTTLSADCTSSTGVITVNEWAVFAVRYVVSTKTSNIFKNGTIIGTQVDTNVIASLSPPNTYLGLSAGGAFNSVDYNSVYIWNDAALTDQQISDVTSYLLTGTGNIGAMFATDDIISEASIKLRRDLILGNELYLKQNSNTTYIAGDAANSNAVFIKNSTASQPSQLRVINNASTSGTGLFAFQTGTNMNSGEYLSATYTSSNDWLIQTINTTATGSARALRLAAASNTSGSINTNQLVLNTDGSISTSGTLSLTSTTDSSSTSTGGLVVAGGAGISKSVYLGGALNFTQSSVTTFLGGDSANSNALYLKNNASTQSTQFRIINNGGANSTGIYIFQTGTSLATAEYASFSYSSNGDYLIETRNSTGTGTTRALRLAAASSNSNTINTNQLVLNTDGSVSTSGQFSPSTLAVSSTTDATSSTTGVLIASGGAGIAKSLFVGTNTSVTGRFALGTSVDSNLKAVIGYTGDSESQLGMYRSTGDLGATLNVNSSHTLVISNASSLLTSGIRVSHESTKSFYIHNGTSDYCTFSSSSISSSAPVSITNTTDSTNSSSGCLILSGGVGITKALFINGSINSTLTTASTSSTTGALLLAGGLAVNNTTDATSSTNGGSISTAGGLAIQKSAFIGTDLTITSRNAIGTTINSSYRLLLGYTGASESQIGFTRSNGGIFSTLNVDSSNTFIISNLSGASTSGVRLTHESTKAVYINNSSSDYFTFTSSSVSTTVPVTISDTTASTSSSTGALILSAGGLGINNTTDATSSSNGGALSVAGGISCAKKGFIGTELTVSSVNLTPTSGDIFKEVSFSGANNQASAANVTGLAFANGSIRGFKAWVTVFVDATTDLFAIFELEGIRRTSDWQMSSSYTGDNTQVVFSITTAGQVQYTSASYTGFSSLTMKFRALSIGN